MGTVRALLRLYVTLLSLLRGERVCRRGTIEVFRSWCW